MFRPDITVVVDWALKINYLSIQTPGQEPSQEMKEMTALATYHVNRILALEAASPAKRQHGHLRKGKLQPLYPVDVAGPSITQCRGILSGDSSFFLGSVALFV